MGALGLRRPKAAEPAGGISPERLPQVFDRSYRAGPHSGGAGLGLAIARQLVEAHRGRLDVASVPGRGATFTIRSPR